MLSLGGPTFKKKEKKIYQFTLEDVPQLKVDVKVGCQGHKLPPSSPHKASEVYYTGQNQGHNFE